MNLESTRRKRLGLFGGSFDPIHGGHVGAARAALVGLELDRVVVLPTARPPHKHGRALAPAWQRFAMVELALLDEARLEASVHELDQRAPAYTVETLRHFAAPAAGPSPELFLILGRDSYLDLPNWKQWQEILELASVAVMGRAGEARSTSPEVSSALETARVNGRVLFLEGPEHAASATEIRRRLAAGESVPDGWLDARVLQYLSKYSLYR